MDEYGGKYDMGQYGRIWVNMIWANMTAIKMQRLSLKNPLNWFSMLSGIIMVQLNKYNS